MTRSPSCSFYLAIIHRWETRRPRESDDRYQLRMDDPTDEVLAAVERENERCRADPVEPGHQLGPLSQDSASSLIEADSDEDVSPPAPRARPIKKVWTI